MGSGDHFGAEAEANMLYAEERMSAELKKRDRERLDEIYRKGVLTPRGRRLFVFKGASPTVFDPEHYPLATDKDVKCDPLVRRLSREIEELRAQLPVQRQCPRCEVSRNTECFSRDEDVCDKCKLASLAEKPSEERRDQALRKLNSLPAFQESLLMTSICPDNEEPTMAEAGPLYQNLSDGDDPREHVSTDPGVRLHPPRAGVSHELAEQAAEATRQVLAKKDKDEFAEWVKARFADLEHRVEQSENKGAAEAARLDEKINRVHRLVLRGAR
jgi:hypothetical protein